MHRNGRTHVKKTGARGSTESLTHKKSPAENRLTDRSPIHAGSFCRLHRPSGCMSRFSAGDFFCVSPFVEPCASVSRFAILDSESECKCPSPSASVRVRVRPTACSYECPLSTHHNPLPLITINCHTISNPFCYDCYSFLLHRWRAKKAIIFSSGSANFLLVSSSA